MRQRETGREGLSVSERAGGRERETDLNHFDVLLIICCEIIFLTF